SLLFDPNSGLQRDDMILAMWVGHVDHGHLLAWDKKGGKAGELPTLKLRVERSHRLDGAGVVPSGADQDIDIVSRSRPAGPTADAMSTCQNERDPFLMKGPHNLA